MIFSVGDVSFYFFFVYLGTDGLVHFPLLDLKIPDRCVSTFPCGSGMCVNACPFTAAPRLGLRSRSAGTGQVSAELSDGGGHSASESPGNRGIGGNNGAVLPGTDLVEGF